MISNNIKITAGYLSKNISKFKKITTIDYIDNIGVKYRKELVIKK